MVLIVEKDCLDLIDNLQEWLLSSEIRIKEGVNSGAFYGWKNVDESEAAKKYPYIYNEITGYALSCFSYLNAVTNKDDYIIAMKKTISYFNRNFTNNLFITGKRQDANFKDKGAIENQIYSFDNGIILSGLLNYYKITKDSDALQMAKKLSSGLIDNFFENGKLKHALLDLNLSPMNYGNDKWSTRIGSYHAKLGIGFLDLYKATNNETYLNVCNSLCDLAVKSQKENGSISNNLNSSDEIYLHPHLYACEGLSFVGMMNQDKKVLLAALRGIEWAISTMTPSGGVPRSNTEQLDQADCTSQLLRLVVIQSESLKEHLNIANSKVENVKSVLLDKIRRFSLDKEKAIRYNDHSNFACTWCTMFALQALLLYITDLNDGDLKAEYFV